MDEKSHFFLNMCFTLATLNQAKPLIKMVPKIKWLEYFCKEIPASNSFCQEMTQQLASSFYNATQLDLLKDTILLAPAPRTFAITFQDMEGFFSADLLIYSVNMAYPVFIAWKSTQAGEAMLPQDEIDPGNILFWWKSLPRQLIKEDIQGFHLDPHFDTSNFRFSLDFQVKVLPHISLNFQIEDGQVRLLQALLNQWQNEWNQRGEGIVHSVGLIYPDSHWVNIDLGSAGLEGLHHLLQTLNDSSLEIESIVIEPEKIA